MASPVNHVQIVVTCLAIIRKGFSMSSYACYRLSIVAGDVAQMARLEYYLMMRIDRVMGRCDSPKVWKLKKTEADYEWR